jgi:exopolysaccharide production protein ExoQ
MPPALALLLWLILVVALLRFDAAKDSGTSSALWVPVIWMFILGSRLPSQWFSGQVGTSLQAVEEGNPLDRVISSGLILMAIGVLLSRSFKWDTFFANNLALTAFLCFALMSVLWSDYPLISLKRWLRDLGNYLVILVALSDRRPPEAIRTLLRRLFFILISLSVVLIKYYPQMGKSWDAWTGVAEYSGVTTGKNMLGVLCLVSGLFFFWDTVRCWANRKERRTKRVILVNVSFIAMTLWLLNKSNSATSRVCLVIGCLVIAAAHLKAVKRRPALLTVLIPVGICGCLVLAVGFGVDISAAVAEAVGRDPTLTDRTKIWSFLLSMKVSPLLGTGYESFWLGPRLQWFWQNAGLGHINEAHNGCLEVYLNLGIIGLSLLGWYLIASYRTICRRFEPFSSFGSLSLALWTILLFHSITEASFRSGLLWLTFLLVAIAVPERASDKGTRSSISPRSARWGQRGALQHSFGSHSVAGITMHLAGKKPK